MAAESDLYAPVKAFLAGQGYVVKGEVKGCDVVGVRGAEPPVVVELKRSFGLALVLQGIDRLALTDRVYLAVGAWPRRMRHVRKLCRRLGFGLLIVAPYRSTRRVEVVLDPVPYAPRKDKRRARLMLREHARRVGDPNRGGATTRVPMVTAYRQEALRCAALVAARGAMTIAALRAADDVPNAGKILQKDYYGWFQRVERATYALSQAGKRGMARFMPAPAPMPAAAPAPAVEDATVRAAAKIALRAEELRARAERLGAKAGPPPLPEGRRAARAPAQDGQAAEKSRVSSTRLAQKLVDA